MRQREIVRAMWLVSVVSLASAGVMTARQDGQPAQPSGEGLPDGPGKDVMVRTCGLCHEARRAASVRLTREGWSFVIEDMVRRGAKGNEDDLAYVLDYLATNFLGEAARPVNVNNAPQLDLESVIGLLRREAAAVVAYRQKHGPFKTVDAIKKVPGVDPKKIEAAKDRIVCF